MKKSILKLLLLMNSENLFCYTLIIFWFEAGDIYFLGFIVTGYSLYPSTDFGETATWIDSTLYTNNNITSIAADIIPDLSYGQDIYDILYVLENHVEVFSWILRNPDISRKL
ncbi:MAG: hypothetical protein K9M99_00965 [Candidatus Cloacimonetes bacterium]|nr:hypothetical protein [Candidatus Cloacimonadota bacterium]